MIRQLLLPAMAGLLLVACGQGERVSDLVSEEDLDRIESELPDEAESLSPAEQAEAETPDADAVLQRWARAMEARNWEEARQVWGDKGEASGLSAEDYAEAHEKYRTVKIEVGEGRAEGAAARPCRGDPASRSIVPGYLAALPNLQQSSHQGLVCRQRPQQRPTSHLLARRYRL